MEELEELGKETQVKAHTQGSHGSSPPPYPSVTPLAPPPNLILSHLGERPPHLPVGGEGSRSVCFSLT